MKIETIKQLEQLIKLCRKYGIASITVDTIILSLTPEAPTKAVKSKPSRNLTAPDLNTLDQIEMPDELSPEDLLFYSVSGQTPPGEGQ